MLPWARPAGMRNAVRPFLATWWLWPFLLLLHSLRQIPCVNRFCNVVMPGRAEGMEKHIAQDCQSAQEVAKQV